MTFFIIYEVKNSAFYEDKTDTNCADVVSLGVPPSYLRSAAYAAMHAVDGAHGGDAEHSEQCWQEIATEQARYAQRAEVDGVFGKVF